MEQPRKRVRIEEHNIDEEVLERAKKRVKVKELKKELKSEIKDEDQFIKKEEPTESQITVQGHTYYDFVDLNAEPESDNDNGIISEEFDCSPGNCDSITQEEKDNRFETATEVTQIQTVELPSFAFKHSAFCRLAKEITHEIKPGLEWDSNGLMALQHGAELTIEGHFKSEAFLSFIYSKRQRKILKEKAIHWFKRREVPQEYRALLPNIIAYILYCKEE